MLLPKKVKLVYQYEGIFQLARRTFGFFHEKYIRPRLPPSRNKYIKLNGVLAPRTSTRILDKYIGLVNYEGPLIRAMKQAISVGDRVVIVGGGNGVSTVMASKLVGDSGDVIVFEGAESMIPIIRETLDIHSIYNVEVRHNIVSEAISLYGDKGGSKIITPSELPECDTLVLDCEGAELDILSNLDQSPKSIVVETHGHLGAPTNEVMNKLSNYEITYEQRISPSKDMSVLGYQRN